MDAVIILDCIMPEPWTRQEPLNPGLHKAGRSNRNDDVESKPRVHAPSAPSAPSAPPAPSAPSAHASSLHLGTAIPNL